MSIFGRRSAGSLFAALAVVSAGLLPSSAAQAQPITSGSFTLTGDQGDYISLGRDWSYSIADGDDLSVSASDDHRTLAVSINGHQGDWWSVSLAAPSGQAITAKTYTGATRYPFNGSGPGLSVSGDGRGCNELTGSFTVDDVVFGPHGYVQTLHASYEQHCEGGTPAARGTVTVDNPVAPAELALGVAPSANGTFNHLNGNATVSGTVTCSTSVPVQLAGTVTQVKRKTIIKGSFRTPVDCVAGTEVAWTAEAVPSGDTPFQRGNVEVSGTATAVDPAYQVSVSKSVTGTVNLSRA